MKFSHVFLFASFAFGAPTTSTPAKYEIIEKRQGGLVGQIVEIVNGVTNTVGGSVDKAANTIHTVVGGTMPILPEDEDALIKNLEIILAALNKGAGELVGVVGNVLSVVIALRSLTQAQLNDLATALTQLGRILNPLAVILKSGTNNLTPVIIFRITDIAEAFPSFLTPLATFLFNLSSFANKLGLTVGDFVTIVQGLTNSIQALVTNFGLTALTGVLSALNSVLSLLSKRI